MRRVIHLANYGGPYPGSFIPMIAAAREAVEGLGEGWSFEAVFSPVAEGRPWLEQLRADGMRARLAPALSRGKAIPWMRSLLSEEGSPSLLHTHFSSWDLPALAAGRIHRGTRVVWHVHTPLLADPRVRATNAAKFAGAGRLVDRILCVGPEIEAEVLARGAPRRRTETLANGIDFGRFQPITPEERHAARVQLGISPESRVLVTFAWDWERKGGDAFLAAAALLRAQGRRVVAVPVTVDPTAAAGGASEHVIPLTAIDDVRSLYAAADVFVAASSGEGLGFAVLEALAVGTPVVASDIISHRFVGGGVPTIRLATREPESLAGAIAAELDAAADLPARAFEARGMLEQRFSLERWKRDLAVVYATLG